MDCGNKRRMKIGIIGSGNIGGHLGRLWARAGHRIYFSFSHDESKLERLAGEVGHDAKAVTPYNAVDCGEIVLFSTPWRAIDEALKQIGGSMQGKVVIDTTNPFTGDGMNVQEFDENDSSSESVLRRMHDARLVKAFNTLRGDTLMQKSGQGVAVFFCGDDADAKNVVAQLVRDAGFEPVDAGTLHDGKKQQPGTDRFMKEMSRDDAETMVKGAATARVQTGVVTERERTGQTAVSG